MRLPRAIAGGMAALVVSFLAGTAGAGQAPRAAPAADLHRAAEGRGVLICKVDAASRRAFIRRYGERPVFITAHEALEVRRDAPAWSAPRCMTEREHARYEQAAGTMARAR